MMVVAETDRDVDSDVLELYDQAARRYDLVNAIASLGTGRWYRNRTIRTLELEPDARVLDVGCGSLRLGRLLIPFLREGHYFGIDPNLWLVEEGVRRELGQDAVRLKRPSFSGNADFDFTTFGEAFDFIIAQSVATHTGPDLLDKLLGGAAASLGEAGTFVFSYIRAEDAPRPADGWHYPACVDYDETAMVEKLNALGLAARPLPWFHPAASWMAAARHEDLLPGDADLPVLSGQVVNRITDTKGYVFRKDG